MGDRHEQPWTTCPRFCWPFAAPWAPWMLLPWARLLETCSYSRFRDWKWWGFSISTAYVIGLIAVIVFGVDGESLNGAERGGYILIGVAHVAALIGAIMYISDIVQLPASDGDCLGQYLTEDLGYTEQSTNTSHQSVVAALQITTIVLGIAFWAAAAVATTLYKGNLDGTTDSPSE